jgi:hypothetical protein
MVHEDHWDQEIAETTKQEGWEVVDVHPISG